MSSVCVYIICCNRWESQKGATDLVVFLLCQQVVKSFIDGLVVVILHRPQVRLDQLQLVHLLKRQPASHHQQVHLEEFILFKICCVEAAGAARYLAKKVNGSAVVQPRRQNGQQVVE